MLIESGSSSIDNLEVNVPVCLRELKKAVISNTDKTDPIRKDPYDERPWPGNPERRQGYKYNEKGFVAGNYPFADIKNPYKGVKTYDVKYVPLSRILPNLSYKDLDNTGLEGPLKHLKLKNFTKDYIPSSNAIGLTMNNPCDISCGKNSVHAIGLIKSQGNKAGDGQWLAKYESPIHGLASHMKMIRDFQHDGRYLYRNRSIQGTICNGMQGFYSKDEDKSLKALRLCWISDACNKINKNSNTKIQRNDRINSMDKETLMAFTQITAENETGCQFTRATLEKAYKLAFGA